jgi:hypothetical protein
MYHEASRIFDGKGALDGRNGDYVYSQVLLILRVILPGSVTVPDDAAPCNWERAIHATEAPILALRTTEAVPDLSGRRAEERESSAGPAVSEIEPAPADSDAAARRPLSLAERAEDFVTDLENLKLLAKVADDLIASYRRDVVEYEGHVNVLGTTFGRTSRDPRDQVLAKLWSVIYREAPSRDARFRSVMQAMKFMTDREENGG